MLLLGLTQYIFVILPRGFRSIPVWNRISLLAKANSFAAIPIGGVIAKMPGFSTPDLPTSFTPCAKRKALSSWRS
jgi:hypothetical protein